MLKTGKGERGECISDESTLFYKYNAFSCSILLGSVMNGIASWIRLQDKQCKQVTAYLTAHC